HKQDRQLGPGQSGHFVEGEAVPGECVVVARHHADVEAQVVGRLLHLVLLLGTVGELEQLARVAPDLEAVQEVGTRAEQYDRSHQATEEPDVHCAFHRANWHLVWGQRGTGRGAGEVAHPADADISEQLIWNSRERRPFRVTGDFSRTGDTTGGVYEW